MARWTALRVGERLAAPADEFVTAVFLPPEIDAAAARVSERFDQAQAETQGGRLLEGRGPRARGRRHRRLVGPRPGSPSHRQLPNGEWVLRQQGDAVYFQGAGGTDEGDRPFLDLRSLEGGEVTRLFRCDPERYERMVPMAAEYNADFIALMWGPEGLPRDENECAALCVELLYFAN